MNVYLESSTAPAGNHAIRRVRNALVRYAPAWVSVVDDPRKAELRVLHVNGRLERQLALARGAGSVAVIQYTVRRTQRPNTASWLPLWRGARVVWSYLDLAALMREDGTKGAVGHYLAPLGADPEIFQNRTDAPRFYKVCTSGTWLTEGVRECCLAAGRLGRHALHLGEELNSALVDCRTGLTDLSLADLYSRCEFVSGLRRTEGFELPMAEGLLCGARPVTFDQPHYRRWFGSMADYVQESARNDVADQLTALFREGPRPVTQLERESAVELFSWERVVRGFWERCE